jgi:hypothetical protein
MKLLDIAHGRSGDKGNSCNIGIIARSPEHYETLKAKLTVTVVKERFKHLAFGKIERFELQNLHSLNFLLHDALDGGGTVSLRSDAQGKTYAAWLLRMDI